MRTVESNSAVASPASDLAHRKDIDGLRAIAVLLVVFDHLGVSFAHGGFIGVDVFFVISGYLITGNILRGLTAGTFTVASFYERRFRRIIPALTVMLAVVSIFAYWVLLPAQLVEFSHSLIAASLCFANVFFSGSRVGYFNSNYSAFLLHTWSLGVEEQFYLVIPIGLVVLFKWRKRPAPYLIAFAILSFAFAVWETRVNSVKAFYWPQTRAWELLCGSLIACNVFPAIRSAVVRSALSLSALLALVGFSYLYVPAIPFPGVSALVPCLAAMLLIANGTSREDVGYKLLTLRPLPFIGAISYSLYLWHWPLIALSKLGIFPGVSDQPWAGYVVILIASFVLATLSWRYVEVPFRFGSLRKMTPNKVFVVTGVSCLLLVSFGGLLLAEHGYPRRFSAREIELAHAYDAPRQSREGTCFIESNVAEFNEKTCLHEVAGEKNILIFGDSHAAALWYGLSKAFPDVNFLQVTAASCHPTYGSYRHSACSQLRKRLFESYMSSLHLDGVVLTERWNNSDDPYDFLSTVDYFRGRRIPVIEVGPAIEYTAPLPVVLSLSEKLRMPSLVERDRVKQFDALDRRLADRIGRLDGVRYVSLVRVLCGAERCSPFADMSRTLPVLEDTDHLSPAGSIMVATKLRENGSLSF